LVLFDRTSRASTALNQKPYLRSSSQGAWMEEMRAHLGCAVSVSSVAAHPANEEKQ